MSDGETLACHGVVARLPAYLDGEVAPDLAGRIEAHLAACPVCRARVAAARGLVARLRGAGKPSVPAALEQRIRQALREQDRAEES